MIILYIKTHNTTGLKYFGKTTRNNPEKYNGSGIYWKRHIKKYGNDVTTTIFGKFDDIDLCMATALKFSIDNDIINSTKWANLRNENGLDGAPIGNPGHRFTKGELTRMSDISTERWADPLYKEKMVAIHRARWTNELKEKQSIRLTGKLRPEHSKIMTGRTNTKISEALKGKPKPEGHGAKVSAATKGVPKSEIHKQHLRVPKAKTICRISDRKEMSPANFANWIKRFNHSHEGEIG